MLDFLGIGAQKSGTTWLYDTLKKHPQIAFPAGKEVHFWDMFYSRGVEWYKESFCNQLVINGDITPAYGHLSIERISEIHATFPQLRIIYLIRNPIERAWSSAKMALSRSEMTIDEASDQWFIDHFQSRGSIARGDYEANLRRWWSVFPQDHILIIRYESLCRDPVAVANRCLQHIGLDSYFTEVNRARLSQKVFEGEPTRLRASLKPVLFEIYHDRIISLEKYLLEDLSAWLGSSH